MSGKLIKQRPRDLVVDSAGNLITSRATTFREARDIVLAITKGPPIAFLHLMGFEIPIHEGDTTTTVVDRISDNPEIPFHKSEIAGQLILQQDQAINEVKIVLTIKL